MENREAINWLTRIRDRLMTTSSKQFEAITIAIAAMEKQERDRWIPVAEKQPELTHFMYDVTPFSDTVLVTVRNQYGAERLVLGDYEQRKGWSLELLDSMDERFQWHAIAWRPLPKAYQEDTNG